MKDSIKYITVYAHATARGRQSITLERNRFKTSGFTKEKKIHSVCLLDAVDTTLL